MYGDLRRDASKIERPGVVGFGAATTDVVVCMVLLRQVVEAFSVAPRRNLFHNDYKLRSGLS